MRKVVGRSFKITKNQARGYGYARPGMKRNPGVTTIAAINGRGAYGGRNSPRKVMGGLSRNSARKVARRRLTAAEKKAFVARMAANRSTSGKQRSASKRNIRKAQTARKAWGRKLTRGRRFRVGPAAYGRKPKARRLKPGVYIANRRKKAGAKNPMAKRRRKRTAASGTKKRRRSSKRRRRTTAKTSTPKRRRRRKASKKSAPRRRRRRGAARKTTTRRRRRRSAARKTTRRRRRRASAAAPKRRRRRRSARKAAPKRRRRRSSKRRSTGRRRRRSSKRRRSSGKRRRSSGRRRKGSGRRRKSRRGSARRRRFSKSVASHMRAANKRGYKANRRRRRGHRRNGRSLFRKNGAMDWLKMGGLLFAGFAAQRVLTNLFDKHVMSRLLPAPAPVATSGFSLAANKTLLSSLFVGVGSAFLATKVIKNQETRKLIVGGIVASTLHGVIVSGLKAFAPAAGDMLAGPEDGTAARLSAMYGLRGLSGGASIMPRYDVINGVRGMGEYFREPMNGMGEYFREPMNGLRGVGEYITATSGLGTYEANSDIYEAAAGMGSHDYAGNHIDPSGDLDRQLTIAEAAAGVGAVAPFEAAAGLMPFEAAAGMRGMGNISTVQRADTWIPGSADGQLWAGVRPIDNGQARTEMVPAGVLQTEGGQGIFG